MYCLNFLFSCLRGHYLTPSRLLRYDTAETNKVENNQQTVKIRQTFPVVTFRADFMAKKFKLAGVFIIIWQFGPSFAFITPELTGLLLLTSNFEPQRGFKVCFLIQKPPPALNLILCVPIKISISS